MSFYFLFWGESYSANYVLVFFICDLLVLFEQWYLYVFVLVFWTSFALIRICIFRQEYFYISI
jgi:hypothetical protein